MSESSPALVAEMPSTDPTCSRTAFAWGIFGGVAFVIATVAFLVEATGLLAASPVYSSTAAGRLADEAKFFVAVFAYQQEVLWDFVPRDGLYFFAYLALIPLGLGLREVAGRRRVAPQPGPPSSWSPPSSAA